MNTNQNRIRNHKFVKLVILCILLTMLSYVFFGYINANAVWASQTRENYSEKINQYPGYKELIDTLKKEHPNWNFIYFYTGLDWNQVIKNETSAYHGRNVVPVSKSSAWKCSSCGEIPHGGSSWRCASEVAVAYYMDPRNWLNDTYVFQFENLSYNGEIQTLEGVQKIIAGMQYMQGNTITYTQTDGGKATLNKRYAQVIMEAAKEAGISPYHLASRIRQEQGAGVAPGSTATGNYAGYYGYYNFLNIKASGSTDREVIVNGLEYAKKNEWTNPEISIKEGAKILASNYIKDGQDTLYLQKFDVDNSDGTLYYFQYMQNVSACVTEGSSVRKTYEELSFLNNSIEFIIPIYENMPETASQEPTDNGIVTQDIKIKGNQVSVRSGASISATKIATVNTGDTLLRIEMASSMQDGYYWDKVVLPNGTKGYIARNYIVEINEITNCNDTVMASTSVNLRNGPGLVGTTVITMLTKGQILTRIETGKYNLDGYLWERVKLADGRTGYIAQNYISITNKSNTNENNTELIKVICNSGLKVREQPGTNFKILTYLDKGDCLTRIEQGTSNIEGYIWDKVVTASGIEGYIARGTSKEAYIEVLTSNTKEDTTDVNSKNDNFKIEGSHCISEPNTTVETIKEKNAGKTVTIKQADGTIVTTGMIGTGYTIEVDATTYSIIKKGDINGDGKVNTVDALKALKYDVGTEELKDDQIKALDVNKDGKVNTVDALTLLKYDVGLIEIVV